MTPTGFRQLVHCPETEKDVLSRIRGNFDKLRNESFALFPYRSVSVGTVANIDDANGTIDCNTTSAGFTVSLLTARGIAGRQNTVKNSGTGGNSVTIKPFDTETIDGAATLVLTDGQVARLQATGKQWIRI